jgi:ribonuclease HI
MSVSVYTDGSLIKKKNIVNCGYGIYFPNNELKNISKKFMIEPITNNRAELYAIYVAIKKCYNYNNKVSPLKNLNIYSDSEYSVKTINVWYNTWIDKNKKIYLNKDIIDKIMILKSKCPFEINIIHIKSHTGLNDVHSINNDMADKLAKQGAFID